MRPVPSRPLASRTSPPRPSAPDRWRAARFVALAGALALLAALGLDRPGAAPLAAQETETLVGYEMVDQFPQRDEAAEGLFQNPIDLDVTLDGHVYVSDPGIGGVHVLLPTGAFTTPFGVAGGFPQQLGQVWDLAVGPDPADPGFPMGAERVYVSDIGVERVVIYDAQGRYVDQWEDLNVQGIATSLDGRVFLLDRDSSQVRVFSAFDGTELFAYGERGLEDGQFTNFTEVDVTPDGGTLVIGDKRGLRVQLFDVASAEALAGETPPEPIALRKVYDLRENKYSFAEGDCRSGRVNALGGDAVFLGSGDGACIVDGRDVSQAIAASASSRTICRDTVSLPRLRPAFQKFVAFAISDPNAGKCGDKRTDLDTTPVIVEYNDLELRQVATVHEAASNEDADNPLLFAPDSLAFIGPDTLFVSDSSTQLRFFDRAGSQVETSVRTTFSGNFSSDFEVTHMLLATGTEVLGEVAGYYVDIRRVQGQQTLEAGIGRFRTVEERGRFGTERVLEEVWKDPWISSFQDFEAPAIAFNPVSEELLVVRRERIEQQRREEITLVRYDAEGREIKPAFDLPDDGKTNPYVDLGVGPDGRIYALDDLEDLVRVYEADGTHVVDVPVAFDARTVAGGPASPEGSVFVMREPGSIERYADDGRISARLDGRPLPFSDPTTLTSIAVDGEGRVYVADGQSSLISVFQPSEDPLVLPVPDDDDCRYAGAAAADPLQLDLGDLSELTLTLEGRCGVHEAPADVVVIVPYYPRLQQGVDPAVTTMNEVIGIVTRMNFQKHRAGLVGFYTTTTVEQELTHDRDAYIESARDVTRFDPPNADAKMRLRDAIEEATAMLGDDPSRRRVMVILRSLYCSEANAQQPGQCAGYPPAEEAAMAARDAGITIVVVNSSNSALDLASSDEDAIFGAENVHRRVVRYAQPELLASELELELTIPSQIDVDASSLAPNARWSAPTLAWTMDELEDATTRFTARLEPTEGGSWPAFERGVARFKDGFGQDVELAFEAPVLAVAAPTPDLPTETPTPEPTGTPASTETPSATPEPVAIYLPFAATGYCFPAEPRIDMVLAVDVSSSMQGAKIEAARQALRAFVSVVNLDERADKVAIVDFATQATLVQGLTADRATLDAAIDGIVTRSGTRIDRGLMAALDELDASGRSDAARAVILLSDGRQVEEPETARQAGAEARSRGVKVYTIGLGEDIDEALMIDVAGDAGRYAPAPTPGDLEAVYRGIAEGLVGCR